MDAQDKRRIVEALILSSPEPISAARLAEIIPYCDAGQAKDLVSELNTEYSDQDRAFEIWEVAGGYQIRTRAEFSGYIQKLQKERALRLSQAALETLAIVAYRQPVTRAEVEEVRGVDSGAIVKSLLERHLIRIAGQREVPGRPMLYGTTRRFLEVFGLERLKDLPTLRDLDELAREQGLLEKTSADAPDRAEAGDAANATDGSDAIDASDASNASEGDAELDDAVDAAAGGGEEAASQREDAGSIPAAETEANDAGGPSREVPAAAAEGVEVDAEGPAQDDDTRERGTEG